MNLLPFARPSFDAATAEALTQVLLSGQVASGPQVEALEAELGAYLGGRTVRLFTSATGAMELVLAWLGIGAGDEVIVPAMSFVATANVVVRVGAKPVFVDVDLGSRNLNLAAVKQAIGPRTKAIMPVHFGGLAVAMDQLLALAKQHQLRVIEDAAHAIGSSFQGQKIGSFGDITVFSFHPNKNMTTLEGGAVAVASEVDVSELEKLRFHGFKRLPYGEIELSYAGGKFNLTDISAVVGRQQLPQLDRWNQQRRALARYYLEHFPALEGLCLPEGGDDDGHSWHMFAPLLPFSHGTCPSRAVVMERMKAAGIATGVHYPSIPAQSFYRAQGYRPEDYPVADRIGRQTLTLPLYPALSTADLDRVMAALVQAVRA